MGGVSGQRGVSGAWSECGRGKEFAARRGKGQRAALTSAADHPVDHSSDNVAWSGLQVERLERRILPRLGTCGERCRTYRQGASQQRDCRDPHYPPEIEAHGSIPFFIHPPRVWRDHLAGRSADSKAR